ncbi:MAG: zinc-binding alcohol dehydrogenase, partial [Pseudomonadota bacterium]
DMALTIPNNVPTRRAILAANMETALNIVWDAGVGPGDRVLVVGCGVVGAFAGYLAAQIIGTEVTLVDLDEERAELAAFLGCAFCTPAATFGDADVVVHASASDAGLATAIGCAGPEATIVEASWYGTAPTSVPLGGRFHQRRLKLVGSQVGTIPPARAPRWDHARRLRKALSLLNDDRLDALISSESRFEDLPSDYGEILHNPQTLCHCVRYD